MSGFFDFQEKLRQTSQAPPPARPQRDPSAAITVSQLTSQIERALRQGVQAVVHVRGEVSNFKLHSTSGHAYFTLKDSGACIDCVMFRSDAVRLKFEPADGIELVVTGRVGVFAQRGRYQLYVTAMSPIGQGALELAFQQLRAKLEAEGLFDAERKRPLPAYPRRIVLITSRSTAALQDMLKVLRPFRWVRLGLFHVPVQGEGAGQAIAEAIRHINRCRGRLAELDLLLLARGGGSLEDLWAFNEECVARAVAASELPIITGIGHEVDVSIADLAADYHAHTPTEAAQVAVSRWRQARELTDAHSLRLARQVRVSLESARQRLAGIERHEVFRRPLDRINQLRQLLDHRERALSLGMSRRFGREHRRLHDLAERLERHRPAAVVTRLRQRLAEQEQRLAWAAGHRLREAHEDLARLTAMLRERHPRHLIRLNALRLGGIEQRLDRAMWAAHVRRRGHLEMLQAHLNAIGPEQVLRRGYTITMLKKGGAVLRHPSQVKGGERLLTRLADGQVESIAEDPIQLPLFE